MSQEMNKKVTSPGKIHILSGIFALLCIAMMFVPVAEDSLAFNEYHYRGEMPVVCSRATSGYYSSEFIWKILALLLIAVAILLLLWAVKSFRKPEKIGGIGMIASIANLVVTAVMVCVLLSGAIQRVLIIVPILLALMAVFTLGVAVKQRSCDRVRA